MPSQALIDAMMATVPQRNERARHFHEANRGLNLTPQEQALYGRHLTNLYGAGGVDNPDGSRSSLYQAVEEHGGKFYDIPTVWDGKIQTEKWTHPQTGKVWDIPNQQALQNVERAGWDSFPSYTTPEQADARYGQMHDYMEKDTGDYFDAAGAKRRQMLIDAMARGGR